MQLISSSLLMPLALVVAFICCCDGWGLHNANALTLHRPYTSNNFRSLLTLQAELSDVPTEEVATTSRRNVLASAATSVLGFACASTAFSSPSLAEEESYRVELKVQLDQNTAGEIELEVYPAWAPLGASRFRELVESGFYDGSRFHRVLPGYVAQFGLSPDPALNKEWLFCEKNCRALPDEKRVTSNSKGTLSFASGGKNSRQTQVFINLGNNGGPPNFLDGQSFVPFAKVVRGMDEVVSKLNTEYGLVEQISGGMAGSVNQGKAAYYGKEYLDKLFPKLSLIQSARVL